MRMLLIENQPVANIVASYCPNIEMYDLRPIRPLDLSIADVALDIKEHYADHIDLYIINVNLQVEENKLSKNEGIELLKMLRLHHINNHIVIYSFLNKEMLMSDIRNAIIFSKGVSFYRLPDFFKLVSTLDWIHLSKGKASEKELLRLFNADYEPNNSHFNANVFGVWKLKKAYERYLEIIKGQDLSDSERVQIKELKYMNSYYGLLYQYINNVCSEDKIEENLEFECVACEKIANKIEKLRKRQDHIIYVDDMGAVGWSELLGKILYGDDYKQFFQTIYFDKKDEVEKIADFIFKYGLKQTKLLILDLRLRNEYGYVTPSELSGIQVLHELERKVHLSFPVLIFTASNKIWSLKETFEGDVMAYYIKEGTGYTDDHSSLMNFLNLMEQICFLTSHSWIFTILSRLKKLSETIRDEKNKFWWETLDAQYLCVGRKTGTVKTYNRIHTDRNLVIDVLDKLVESAQNKMRHICFFKNSLLVSEVLSLLMLKLSIIVNEIHRSKERKYDIENGFTQIPLGDLMKAHLPGINPVEYLKLRNKAVHQARVHYELPEVDKTVDLIVKYLILKPTPYSVGRFSEADITPVADRYEKLQRKEPIIVEVVSAGFNRLIAGPDNHGYVYDFIIEGESTWFVQSDSVLENIGKGDIVEVQNIGKSGVPIGDMELKLVL